MKTYRTHSSDETKSLGERLAKVLKSKSAKRATIITLEGDLGAGKTTFTQGFLKGLGIKRKIPSPTFVIMKRYKLKHPHFANAHHMDAYRLRKTEDVNPLGFEKLLGDPKNILLVEWPENINGALPKNTKKIVFKYGKKRMRG